MSVYEPKSVLAIIRNSSLVPANERERFQADWVRSVSRLGGAHKCIGCTEEEPTAVLPA